MLDISLICLNNVRVCVFPPFYRLLPEIIYCGTPWENVLQRLCLEIFECQNASAYSVIRWCRFYFLYRLKRRRLCSSTLFLESFWSSLFQFSRKITNPQILVSQAVKPEPIQSWCLKWNFPSLATVAFLLIVALHAGVAMPSDL